MLLGLDALDHRWLDRWLQQGRLPNLAAFAARSTRLAIHSDGELLHGSVWPTFASGTGPGHHGIYWWTQWLAEDACYVRNSHGALHYDPFWRFASDVGRRSIVVDVPHVPVLPLPHTWTALGWGLHDEVQPASYPARFLRAIQRRYGDHPLRVDTLHSMDPAVKRRMAAALIRGVEMRAQLVRDVAARDDWEFFFTTFSETHKAGHYLAAPQDLGGMTNDDALVEILAPLDHALPEIVERAGSDCDVFVFAVHGMQEQVDYSPVAPQFAALVDGRAVEEAVPSPDAIRRLRNLMPAPLQQAIWYLVPPSIRNRRFAHTVTRGLEGGERIFHVALDGALALRVNLAGRERDGTVSPEEYERLLARAAGLAQPMTVNGVQAFLPLVRTARAYPGPRAHRLPDALVPLNLQVPRAEEVHGPGGTVLRNPVGEARNGVHTGSGFCFFRPGAPIALTREAVDSLDFAPTVLARLGVESPAHLQGTPFLA